MNRFQAIRQDAEVMAIDRETITGMAEPIDEQAKKAKYPVLVSGIRIVGSKPNLSELEPLKEKFKALMGSVNFTKSIIWVGNRMYDRPLMRVTLTDERKQSESYLKMVELGVVCVEYRVWYAATETFVDEFFRMKEKKEHPEDKLLFSVGGVWNKRSDTWLFEPEARDVEFWL